MPSYSEIARDPNRMSYPQLLVPEAAQRHTHYAIAWCSDHEVGIREERNIKALSDKLGGEVFSFGGKEVHHAAKETDDCDLGPRGPSSPSVLSWRFSRSEDRRHHLGGGELSRYH